MASLKILYSGSMHVSSNSYRRFTALAKMGFQIIPLDIDSYVYCGGILEKFHHHFNWGPGINRYNRKIYELSREFIPDILWIDNRIFLQPGTLKKISSYIPEIKIVNVITDDPFGSRKYSWRLTHSTASLVDYHFVQRTTNLHELKSEGAKNVHICYRSFDPEFNRPIVLQGDDINKYSCQVGFVGTYEEDRASFIAHLILNGIAVYVTGNDWPDKKYWEIIEPYYKGPSVYGDAYIKTICGMDIALHFLRHMNRDEQDSRTFEIPASKVFMLAERSAVHEQLFRENEEAVFFDTKEELLIKVKMYLSDKTQRKQIAEKGYKRCYESGYDHQSRLKEIIQIVTGLR
ncbi:MAG: glycosyltransferase [Ferruginibacter sp.]|nr:glycosyltransferase [Ferruginibacter sp.]